MSDLLATAAIDLIPYPAKPVLHEKMTFEAIIYCLNWNDNNPDPASCLTPQEVQLLLDQLPSKVDGCAQWQDKLEDDAKRARDYARKFSEAARQIEAQHDRFLGYVKKAMEKHGFEKLPGDAFQVALRKSSSVNTTRPPTADDALSDLERFIRTKITYEWDKAAIKDAIKSGEDLDFATVETSTSVQFSIKKG